MKIIPSKIFNLNKFIEILLFIISIFLLIYVLCININITPLSYITYLLSTYSLILFIIEFTKICKRWSKKIKETKVYSWYNKKREIIIKYTLVTSSFINLLFGIFEFATGLYSKSWWLITFAIYYLILCYMTFFLLKDIKQFGSNLKLEYKKLKNTGYLLLLLNIILVSITILVLYRNEANIYPNNLIYGVALYDFYLIIIAIINVCKHWKNNSPVISASKCISLAVAMISILSLEVAMIYEFGGNDNNFKIIITGCTSFSIVLINTIMSIIMIYKGKNNT